MHETPYQTKEQKLFYHFLLYSLRPGEFIELVAPDIPTAKKAFKELRTQARKYPKK
jgi:hypothetical protein